MLDNPFKKHSQTQSQENIILIPIKFTATKRNEAEAHRQKEEEKNGAENLLSPLGVRMCVRAKNTIHQKPVFVSECIPNALLLLLFVVP